MIISMVHFLRRHSLVLLLLGAALFPSAAHAANGCVDNRTVQSMIASGQIKTWPGVKAMAGIPEQYKEVSAVRLCVRGGQPYYIVNMAGPSGESKQLVLNAVTGSR
jgi:hypothetical protein